MFGGNGVNFSQKMADSGYRVCIVSQLYASVPQTYCLALHVFSSLSLEVAMLSTRITKHTPTHCQLGEVPVAQQEGGMGWRREDGMEWREERQRRDGETDGRTEVWEGGGG